MEELVEKVDEKYTEWIQITRPEVRTQVFVNFSDFRSHYQGLIKLYRHSKNCGNQTSLASFTSDGDNASARHSAEHGSRKQPSIANSRSSRRRQKDEMELKS